MWGPRLVCFQQSDDVQSHDVVISCSSSSQVGNNVAPISLNKQRGEVVPVLVLEVMITL